MPRENIVDRLRAGDVLVLDGATGTELEARGIACDSRAWSATANLEAPDALRAIHEDYLKVGADIITANNFSTGPSALSQIGEGERWRDYSQAGLDIALSARDAINPNAYVAGGISTYPVPANIFGPEYTDRARLLADGGADFILAEFLPTVSDCVAAAEACAEIDLPFFLGVGSLGADGNLADGTPVETLVSALQAYRVDVLLAMCTFPPAISKWLPRLRDSFPGFIGAYAHGGWKEPDNPRWAEEPNFDPENRSYTPDLFAEYARTWKEMGAQIIGGCCATRPSHIAALPAALH